MSDTDGVLLDLDQPETRDHVVLCKRLQARLEDARVPRSRTRAGLRVQARPHTAPAATHHRSPRGVGL